MSVKAGVIGAGVFGGHHARKHQADPRVQLVGIYDLDSERTAVLAEDLGVKAFDKLEDLIDAVDVITIASPPATHAAAGVAALDAGKHVFVEKPIATTLMEAEAMIALANLHSRVLACGHQERLVFEAMGLFAAPEKPLLIESVREGPWTGRSADVSVTLDLMVHDFDLASTLLDAEPSRIEAVGKAHHGPSADKLDARLYFAEAEANFTSSRIAEARKRTMRIVYPSGEVKVDFLARTFENSTRFRLNADFADTPAGRDPLGQNVALFIDAVLGKAPRPGVTGEEAKHALSLALAADRAAGFPSLST
ncbi:MAG TPA: Gfo/Idh/MocA family oxidoreductase [Caulobacterales bacterium]|nr:Gfo/Idh/MocA family oxidoreductase [Caulobacterales bacterium]